MKKKDLYLYKKEIILQVDDLHKSVEKLSYSPVINSNVEFINQFVTVNYYIKQLKTILVSDWKIHEIMFMYKQLYDTYVKLNSKIPTVQIEYQKTLIP
jgi:hypothetical protein